MMAGVKGKSGGRRAGAGNKPGTGGPRFREGERVLFGQFGAGLQDGVIQSVTRTAYYIQLANGTLIGIERKKNEAESNY